MELSERKGLVTVRHGKGNKYRTVPLNLDARRALAPWLDLRPTDGAVLFTDKSGATFRSWGVQSMLRDYCRRAGVAITPHQLRHWLGKSLVDKGVPESQIAALMGHSSLNTTRRYIMPSAHDLKRAVETLEG